MAHARCPQCKAVSDFVINELEEHRRRGRYLEDEDGYLLVDLCRVCGYGGIERSVDQGGYFNRELRGIVDEWPRLGRLCDHCGHRLPRFLELPPETATLARKLSSSGHPEDALNAIVAVTGCPVPWAKLWVDHPTGPRDAES